MLSILRTGSPVEVNIWGVFETLGAAGLGAAGARLSPLGNVDPGTAGPGSFGNVNVGLATPEPTGSWPEPWRVLANFIEPVIPIAVLGNLGMRVTSKAFPA